MENTDSNINFWDNVAKFYGFIQEKCNRGYYKELVSHISSMLNPSDVVLELGCGTGQLTMPLSALATKWTATDFSEKMIIRTKKRLANAANVECRQEDATRLSFAEDSFDVVVIANVLHIMPNPAAALREIKRVLISDGLLIAPTYIYDGRESLFRLRLMESAGFRTFNKWTADEYEAFVSTNGFAIKDKITIPTKTLTNCLLTAMNRTGNTIHNTTASKLKTSN